MTARLCWTALALVWAAVAANQHGVNGLVSLVEEHGFDTADRGMRALKDRELGLTSAEMPAPAEAVTEVSGEESAPTLAVA